jgi:hypothetical protein
MTLNDLNAISAVLRWFGLLASVSGLLLALLSFLEAHRGVVRRLASEEMVA